MKFPTLISLFSIVSVLFLSSCASKPPVEIIEFNLNKGIPSKAIERATIEIEKGTSDPWIYAHRAQAFIMLGDLDDAQRDILKAQELSFKEDVALLMLAQIAMKRNDYDRAAELAGRVALMKPEAKTPLEMKDAAIKRGNMVKNAHTKFELETTLVNNPAYAAKRVEALAILEYYNMYDSKRIAIDRLRKFAKAHPDNLKITDTLSWFIIMDDKSSETELKNVLDSALAAYNTDKQNIFFVDTLSAAYAANGDFKNALKYLADARELIPSKDQLAYLIDRSFAIRKDSYKANKRYIEKPQEIRILFQLPTR